jgi:hypothetical protein
MKKEEERNIKTYEDIKYASTSLLAFCMLLLFAYTQKPLKSSL